ncbi:MAG: O-antigen ligase family protein [Bacteroidetes bacterium]|nr:O-antigen ligase family protein [Bacteroidota bacterium]
MQEAVLNGNKWGQVASWCVLVASIIAYAFTGNLLLIALPFAFLFVLLTAVNWKAAYWIFLFIIPFSFHIEFANGSLSTTVPDEPIMWLFLLTTGLLVAKNPEIIKRNWLANPIVVIVVLQYVWLIIPVLYSHKPLLSLKFFAAKTWFLASFFLLPLFVFKDKKDFKKGFLVMFIPILITVCIIMVRHAAIGFNFRRIQVAIGKIYVNHVDYSTVMSMIFPVLCVALPLTKGKSLVLRGIIVLMILFLLPAIYFTYARAAVLAVFFAFVVGVAIRLKLVNFIMPVFYGALALLIVYMVHDKKFMDFRPDYEHTFMRKKFTDHLIATFKGQDMSSMERLYRWIAAVRMSTEEPIKGYGPNNFIYYYKEHAVPEFKTYVSRNFEHSTTHNYYLYMLVEQGWPAMLLYAALIMVVFAQAQKTYHRFKDRYYKYCTLGVIMMFAAGFINNFFSELIETDKVGCLFYLSIALLVVLTTKSKQMEQEAIAATQA